MEIYQDKLRVLITYNISFSSSHRAIVSSSIVKVKIKAARKESHTCFEQHDSVQIDVMNYSLKLHAKLI